MFQKTYKYIAVKWWFEVVGVFMENKPLARDFKRKIDPHVSPTVLTHWGGVTHICVSRLTIIGSDNSLSPSRRQAIIWPNAGILLIGPVGTNFSEILFIIHTSSFRKMHLKMSSGKWRPFCLGLNVWTHWGLITKWANFTNDMHYQAISQLSVPMLTKFYEYLWPQWVNKCTY